MNKNSKIWFNGKMQKFSECNINLFTHALHYGTSVFDGCRAYGGKIFKLVEHHQRLIDSGKICDIEIPYSMEQLNNAANDVLGVNKLENAYIRAVGWKGDESLGVKSSKNTVNIAIMAWEWPNYYDENKISTGLNLASTDWVRPDPRSCATQAKVGGNYYLGSAIQNKAKANEYDDALMLDWRGYVAECTASNVFFIKNNEIFTPIADCFLNGITRQVVFEIAKNLDISCTETRILPQELSDFDECFVTGTAAEIMPVGRIFDIHEYNNFEITNKVRNYYLELVRK